MSTTSEVPNSTVLHYQLMQAQAEIASDQTELAAARATIEGLMAALRLCIAADDSTHEAKMQARRQARALLGPLNAEGEK